MMVTDTCAPGRQCCLGGHFFREPEAQVIVESGGEGVFLQVPEVAQYGMGEFQEVLRAGGCSVVVLFAVERPHAGKVLMGPQLQPWNDAAALPLDVVVPVVHVLPSQREVEGAFGPVVGVRGLWGLMEGSMDSDFVMVGRVGDVVLPLSPGHAGTDRAGVLCLQACADLGGFLVAEVYEFRPEHVLVHDRYDGC